MTTGDRRRQCRLHQPEVRRLRDCRCRQRSLPLLCRGQIDSMQTDPHFVVKKQGGRAAGGAILELGRGPRHRPGTDATD